MLRPHRAAARAPASTERPVSAVVADLNPVLRGWAAYFRNGNSGRKFNVVDGYVDGVDAGAPDLTAFQPLPHAGRSPPRSGFSWRGPLPSTSLTRQSLPIEE
ncbi:group II intron maturase-specific domain-containing protein [Streptomyces sp. BE133]|uniref:group II intron maturase-specific domain-containing protein n=1 Tax=Streptomyces sp. BE133 TaxID=3002523 RepID=UPI003FA77117